MNQILSVEIEKKKKKGKASEKSILIVFSIFLMIFGIGITTTGAYSYYKNISNKDNENPVLASSEKPIITTERPNANTIKIVVTHDKEIENVWYTLDTEETVEINTNKKSNVEKTIKLNPGTHTIKIFAEDIRGIQESYESTINVEENVGNTGENGDSIEVNEGPTVILTPEAGKVKAVTESETGIDKIIYYWDEDEANSKTLTINDKKNETLIDVTLEGTHTLTIKAIDVEGKQTVKQQKVMGVNKPKLEVTTDGQSFFIKAEDETGLAKIEITLNNNTTISEEINGNKYDKTINLESGENKLTVKVYNKNEIEQISRVKYTKE